MKKNKILIIVESPSKIPTISKYLGAEYSLIASYGHIYQILDKGRFGIGVATEKNFEIRYRIIPEKKDKVQAIIDAAGGVKSIILCSDNDREGEAISANLAEVLSSTGLPIFRATFNEITKLGVSEAMANLRDINWNIVDAQKARAGLDRIVGYQVSPYLISNIAENTSAGRVQSATLKILVDKEREIENFKPEEYWSIYAALKKDGAKEVFQAKYANKVTDKITAMKVKQDLEAGSYQIISIDQEEKKKKPLPPLITSSLCAGAASRYKFAAAKTMKLAQQLYESGIISYMRTDSLRCSDESMTSCKEYLIKKKLEVPKKYNLYSLNSSQDAHECCRPTDVFKHPDNVFLSDDEQKIYRLIWERFVASQMLPALYDMVAMTIKTSDGHILRANGKTLKYKGWLEIMTDGENDDHDVKLPLLSKGDNLVLALSKVKAEQKATQPPGRFSEKTLIEELEKRGIGRPSTYATILSKITDRNYVTRKNNIFYPTDLGKKVIDNLVQFFDFVKPEYTASMEEQLDLIAEGKSDYLTTMQNFYTPFSGQLKKAYNSNKKDYGFICEKCNEKMELAHGQFGYYLKCPNYKITDCKNTFSVDIVDDKPVRREEKLVLVEGVNCPKCQGQMSKKDGKFGPYYSCVSPKCNGSRKVPFGKKCPNCGGELYATIYQGSNVLFCMNYSKNSCKYQENINIQIPDPKKLIEKISKK